jgi:hypothetical protein
MMSNAYAQTPKAVVPPTEHSYRRTSLRFYTKAYVQDVLQIKAALDMGWNPTR